MQVCPKMTKMDPNHFPYIRMWILESCLGQMDKIHVSFNLLWGAGGVCVCCDTVSLDLWCGFLEIFRSHFTSQQITDKTKSVSGLQALPENFRSNGWCLIYQVNTVYSLLSYSVVWSLLWEITWDHCCVPCHDITQDMPFTWYIVHQPI